MFFNIGLVDMKCASAVLPTDDPSSKTYFWSKIENCTLNTLFPTLQSRFAEQLVPLRVIPRSLRNHPQHYTQRSSATGHLHDTPGVKLTHQVSSEISDLRNRWLHAICACAEWYSRPCISQVVAFYWGIKCAEKSWLGLKFGVRRGKLIGVSEYVEYF